ncbi:MAG TPA: bifunctional 3'-5' exonuclease/DNA polymerase [Pseudonocardiaceae bacterium]|nr:bifunctional 3'-5' exonuclease/DNA polymerase [Pseudonocardiaceae bacterium]
MLAALIPGPARSGRVRLLGEDGTSLDTNPDSVPDLAARVAEIEREHRPRWLWPCIAEGYPALLAAGVRVDRGHDALLAEGILLNYHGQHGQPRGLAAAWARTQGLPAPADPPPARPDSQPALFEPEPEALPGGADPMDALIAVYLAQRKQMAATEHPDRVRLLAAADSAGALAAVEMSHHGLPWRVDVHEAILTDLLGPRPPVGARPRRLTDLAERVSAAFGGLDVNPDAPPSVVRAFRRVGIDVPSARARVIEQVDHPAVEPLLEYKELSRLYSAHGWHWLDAWVHNGRFRPEYVVGGVISGRWATRGGAALQLPKVLRSAVRAEPGWVLVSADAAQLEPRVLAALSRDDRLAEVSADADLYASLARDSFADDRGRAKIAMLSAMYGGTSGEAGPLLAILRKRFPDAVNYVEDAARSGEQGRMVRSRLGRTSPAPGAAVRDWGADGVEPTGADERRSRQAAREWGRFTRNFVVQASAADWAAALLAGLRGRLAGQAPTAELVFFQHDEVLVHCRAEDADTVVHEVSAAAESAGALVFGRTPVRFPLEATVVDCYADAK